MSGDPKRSPAPFPTRLPTPRPDTRRATLLGALLAAALLLLTAPGAHAEDGDTNGAKAGSGPKAGADSAKIATALRESPVYVDAAYAGAVPPARQKKLVADIEETKLPIKVVLVPLVRGDSYDGDPDVLADLVRDRLDQRELVMITTDEMTNWLSGHEWPADKYQAVPAVNAVGHLDEMTGASLAARVTKAIELVAERRGQEVYDEATADLGAGTSSSPADGTPWLPVGVGIGAGVLALAGVGAGLYVRRGRGGGLLGSRAGTPFAQPQAVFAAAHEADLTQLRRRAQDEVLSLGEAVRAVDISPGHGEGRRANDTVGTEAATLAAIQQALDAYTAAGTVLDAAGSRTDLAGVLALTAEGRDALQSATSRPSHPEPTRPSPSAPSRSAPLPLCFFNPLHGRAARRIDWRPLGSRRQLDVAACAECVRAVGARRAPEVLTVELGGRTVPYFEQPAEDSVWAATGYGSLVDDGLAHHVNRGDFSRARRRSGAAGSPSGAAASPEEG